MKLVFVSRDASWQKYRLEVLDKLAVAIDGQVEILTTGRLADYLHGTKNDTYNVFKSWLPAGWKPSFFLGVLIYIVSLISAYNL